MSFKFIENKIRILTFVLVGIYLFMIISHIIGSWDSAKLGYQAGYNEDERRSYFVKVMPSDGYLHFPETLYNNVSQDVVEARSTYFIIRYNPEQIINNYAYDAFNIFFVLTLLALFIMLPIKFFGLMSLFKKGLLFENKSIKLIRQIGWMLLSFYVIFSTYNYVNYLYKKMLFDFPDYVVKYEKVDVLYLIVAFVALLFAEVIAKGLAIKREQELTI